MKKNIEKLLAGRKDYSYGEQRDYLDHGNCIGWMRTGTDDVDGSGCAVLLSNGDEGVKSMEIGKKFAGKRFIDLLGKHPPILLSSQDKALIESTHYPAFSCRFFYT